MQFQLNKLSCPTILFCRRSDGCCLLTNFCISFVATLFSLSFPHFLPARALCMLCLTAFGKFQQPTGLVKYFFLRRLVNFVSQVQIVEKQTEPITLGLYLRTIISRVFHLSSKVLEVSLKFRLTLDGKIASFLWLERSL